MPAKYAGILQPKRYKGMRGGRGAARSWSAATALLAYARSGRERILCTREYQTTIRESVHHLLRARIGDMGIANEFEVTETAIRHPRAGSEFIFKGLRHDPQGIKSLEGITKVWIEEARTTSADSLTILDPTIRTAGSEIWATWNPEDENDAIENLFRVAPPDQQMLVEATWRDNPFFPEELRRQREAAHALAEKTGDWDAYEWIWEGQYRRISDAAVFQRRVSVESFETPDDATFYHGADWGFANDPTALVRCYITREDDGLHLWIDQEAFGWGIANDEIPTLFDRIRTARRWHIYADCARPETIHHVAKLRYDITGAEKWPGSVEDGIGFLKSFVRIHVHERCVHMRDEAKLYSYKVDRNQVDPKTQRPRVLPILVDAHNHGWDAIRYALVDHIRSKSAVIVTAAAMQRSRHAGARAPDAPAPVVGAAAPGFRVSAAALVRSMERR